MTRDPHSDLTLVIETTTAACSVALIAGRDVLAAQHAITGRGHAERLVPMIADLPDGGHAARILVGCGPGSFTGVRVGLAAARALGFGWGATVSGYSSLALVAATGFARHPEWDCLAAVLEGGHGEVFMQAFDAPLGARAPLVSLRPDAALAALGTLPAIGNGIRSLQSLDPDRLLIDALPDARDAVLLSPADRALPPRPIYGRAPDAKPSAA